ncbi:unnamed protein product [Ectocarpus sp. CCAP 1310/34]|nr:unnamed protein product [Ectocarpus sp. CCAP 1310/34]
MVPTRQRATRAAAAALIAASICCRHTAAEAFTSSSRSRGASNHLAFAPAHGQSWLAQPRASHQSAASSTGRGRRIDVRERRSHGYGPGAAAHSVFELPSAWGRSARSRQRGRGSSTSKLSMMASVEDAGDASSSLEGDEEVEPFMPAPLQGALPAEWQKKLSQINKDPAKLTFFMNAAVVFLFAAFAAFKLATVDGDIARGWTWYEVLLRVPGDNFYRYEATVSESPIVTKALTSCVAYGLGDFTAQLFTGKTLENMDLMRTARSATAGLLIHGPLCHFWIELMQTYLDFDGAWWNFIPKVIADQTVWSVFLNAAYSTMIMSLQGLPKEEVWGEVKSKAWPALTSSWRFWPLIHCCSFSNAIPKDLKLLFIDCMEIIWVTILSTVANGDRQADPAEGEMVPAMASGSTMPKGDEGGLGGTPVAKKTEKKGEVVHR